MSKPETVSQEAWDAASDAYWFCNPMGERAVSQETIALAIMAAKAEEREACAALVEGADSWTSRFELAAAIRKRGGE